MVKIELTEQELNNLKVFLTRVQLTGAEVGEFVAIVNKLRTTDDKNDTKNG